MKVILEPVARPYLLKIIEDDKKFIRDEMDKIWNNTKRGIDGVKGFRKGKVPRDIAEKSIGFGRLYNSLIDTLFHKSLKEIDKKVIDVSNYSIEAFSKDFISIKVLIEVKPEVLKSQYKGITVEMAKEPQEVTSKMIDSVIDRIRETQSELKSIDVVAMGNSVVMDFEGFIDGKAFKGGKAVKHKSELNPSAFIPGFAEQLVGMKVGEEKEINVTFPKNYQAKELEGKVATFKIKIHEVSEKILPDLDDEFAKTNNFETMEEMRKEHEEILKKNVEQQYKAQLQHNALSEVIKNTETEPLPEVMIIKTSDKMLKDQLRHIGMKEEDYFKKTKGNRDRFRQQNYFAAKNDVMGRLILEYIVEKENFLITEEDKEEYLVTEANRLGMELEKLKESIPDKAVEENLKVMKAYELICDSVVITEPKKPEPVKVEKPPVKEEVKDAKESEEKSSEDTKDQEPKKEEVE